MQLVFYYEFFESYNYTAINYNITTYDIGIPSFIPIGNISLEKL